MKVNEEKDLELIYDLTSVDVLLQEVRGSLIVFAGRNRELWPQLQYFVRNVITESCYRITKPLGKDKIIEQIKNDFSKVTIEEYGEEEAEEDDYDQW